MFWRAVLRSGEKVDQGSMRLADLLAKGTQVERFYVVGESGQDIASVVLPPLSTLVAFKRNYVSTDGSDTITVYVMGWESPSGTTLAFIQPNGLVEISQDREFVTAFERELVTRSTPNGCNS